MGCPNVLGVLAGVSNECKYTYAGCIDQSDLIAFMSVTVYEITYGANIMI